MGATIATFLGQSVIAATLVSVLAYLCRNLLEARLTRAVQHEFDEKLAAFRAQLDEDSQRRESVRSTALAAMLAQRGALAAKRIDAAQELWNGVLEARKGVMIAIQYELINVETVVAETANPKMVEFLNTLASGEAMTNEWAARVNRFSANRPFVSPAAWALYAVYSTVIFGAISRMKILQLGANPNNFISEGANWVKMVMTVLPEDDSKKIGSDPNHGLQWALGRVEERLVEELQRSLAEGPVAMESALDAQRIVEQTDAIRLQAATGVAKAVAQK